MEQKIEASIRLLALLTERVVSIEAFCYSVAGDIVTECRNPESVQVLLQKYASSLRAQLTNEANLLIFLYGIGEAPKLKDDGIPTREEVDDELVKRAAEVGEEELMRERIRYRQSQTEVRKWMFPQWLSTKAAPTRKEEKKRRGRRVVKSKAAPSKDGSTAPVKDAPRVKPG